MPDGRPEKPAPLYERVKQHITERVARGEWADGERLPSEHELMAAFKVSRMTVHRALRELSAEGVISRIQGVGSFVSTPKPRLELIEIRDIAEDVTARGQRHGVKVLRLEAIRAGIEQAMAFDLRPGARIFHSLIVHLEDEMPIQIEERFVNPVFAPAYLDQDFAALSTTRYLQSVAAATEIEHVVFALNPDAETRGLLDIGPDEACLRLARRTWVSAVPATHSLFTYPGSRYSLGSRYKVGG